MPLLGTIQNTNIFMDSNKLSPISLTSAIGIFSFSCVVIIIGIYLIIPVIIGAGTPFLFGYLVAFQTVPFVMLFIQMIYLYRKEGNLMQLDAFKQRMRLTFHWKFILAGFAIFVLGLITYIPLQSVTKILASTYFFTPPGWFPADLHPLKASVSGEFMGFSMYGKTWIPFVYLIGWFFNVFGEELLFRGFILPRQELKYGKSAWFINGLLWNVWHVFWRWQMIALLPFHLMLTFSVQKTKNTWVGIIAHGLLNFIAVLILFNASFFKN